MKCLTCNKNKCLLITLPCDHTYCISCSQENKNYKCQNCQQKFIDELPGPLRGILKLFF